jgi:uncharacterized protein with ParB-like and HNH nuclease domain
MPNQLNTIPIKDFLNHSFLIDEYQRGYKWTVQQVVDLLNDINEFDRSKEAFYCLQPLAVKELTGNKKEKHFPEETKCYEVVDGQQRLTTVFLIFQFLGQKYYAIDYQTREASATFLKTIKEYAEGYSVAYNNDVKELSDSIKPLWNKFVENTPDFNNIDNYHFFAAYLCIKAWFAQTDKVRADFHKTLADDTRFIWYEDGSAKDAKVLFRNLNSGKIGLTNAELIKALFINKLKHPNKEVQTLQQDTFAREWDEIEQSLQDDDFWFFINNSTDDNRYQTRIDFLFEIIVESPKKNNDKLYTYRYFDKNAGALNWDNVKLHYLKLNEWYNNDRLYHLIGYIIDRKIKSEKDLVSLSGIANTETALTKTKFKVKLENIIYEELTNKAKYDLDELAYGENSKEITDILLWFNIEQYQKQISGLRFPFKSFKNMNWTLEHIHAQNTDDISTIGELKAMIADVAQIEKDIAENIELREKKGADDERKKKELEDLKNQHLEYESNLKDPIRDLKDKCDELVDGTLISKKQRSTLNEIKEHLESYLRMHHISNMVLLDGSTNSGLGKRPFTKKRDYILKKYKDTSKNAPYIPLSTINVFLKYYTPNVEQYKYWGYQDRVNYLGEIKSTLNPNLNQEEA